MEKKKKPNWFMRILALLFFIYISLTIAIHSGYYEAKLNQKTILTEESMRQFEEDVKEGKDIDIKDYLGERYTDYSTKTSKTGVAIASSIEKFMTEGIAKVLDVFKTLFT